MNSLSGPEDDMPISHQEALHHLRENMHICMVTSAVIQGHQEGVAVFADQEPPYNHTLEEQENLIRGFAMALRGISLDVTAPIPWEEAKINLISKIHFYHEKIADFSTDYGEYREFTCTDIPNSIKDTIVSGGFMYNVNNYLEDFSQKLHQTFLHAYVMEDPEEVFEGLYGHVVKPFPFIKPDGYNVRISRLIQ